MTTTIAHVTGVVVPEVVNGFEGTREARTIVHAILGRPDPDVTFRPAGLRTGTLRLVFATGAAAAAAEAALTVPQVLTLIDNEVPEVGMSFVVAEGDIVTTLDTTTRVVWIVALPFREVTT